MKGSINSRAEYRYLATLGVIEITTPAGPLFDLILDATETNANPAALVWVRRRMMPAESEEGLRAYAASIGAEFIK